MPDEVRAVIERYRQGFASLDGEALRGIWDSDYDDLVYVAMEETRPRRGWEAISTYYDSIDAANPEDRPIAMKLDDLSVDVLGQVAYAFCRFEFIGEASGERFTIAGRVTFILRQREGDWRVIHYHESAPRHVDSTSETEPDDEH